VADAQLHDLRDIGDPVHVEVVEAVSGLHLQPEAMGLPGRYDYVLKLLIHPLRGCGITIRPGVDLNGIPPHIP